jgi:Family of unknown function (DUF6498)
MSDARGWWWFDLLLAVGAAVIIGYGVLVLGWSVFAVMALFWLENVVIGIFNVARMLITGVRLGAIVFVGALAMAAFFTVHYGMFTAVHGVFVVMLFGTGELGREAMNSGLIGPVFHMLDRLLIDRDGWLAIGAIVALHGASFAQWWGASRAAPTPLKELMGAPYGRIMILHVTLIAGGFLVQALRAPVAGALLLIAMKLAYDLVSFSRARVRPGDSAAMVRDPQWATLPRNVDERP